MSKSHEFIRAKNNRELFIFGDHASKEIPEEYDNLGLSGNDLVRHIAWDIGTETVIRRLCENFGCAGQLAGVSRLVVDLNRDVSSHSIIPEISDETVIPGNAALSLEEKKARIDQYHTPYHEALAENIDALGQPFILSVHSFTPKPRMGEARKTDIGLLVKEDEHSAAQLHDNFLSVGHSYNVGMNEPYSAYDLNYTIDRHAVPRGLRHLAIEIRQDHIDTEEKANEMADIFTKRLASVLG
jgi:predicted N-formylglutamate amidohydrolase